MAKKIILNIFYNVAILTLILCMIWLFNHKYYPLLIGSLFVLALFVYLKIQLVKSVKVMVKKKVEQKYKR